MYPYHNQIKKRIRNREYINHEYVDSYNKINAPVMLIYFSTKPKVKPIRKLKWDMYEELIDSLTIK